MAKAINILGGFSGKVGPVVGIYREGKYYMRSLPAQRCEKPSPRQIFLRQRMALVNGLITKLRPFIHLNACGLSKTQANSMAFRYVCSNAITVTPGGTPALQHKFATIPFGDIPGLQELKITRSGIALVFTWSCHEGPESSADDIISFIAVQEREKHVVFSPALALRRESFAEVVMPPGEWHLFYAVRNALSTGASVSPYLGQWSHDPEFQVTAQL